MTGIHHYSIIHNGFTTLKIPCGLPIYPSLPHPLVSMTTTDLFTVSIVLPFPECHMLSIIQYGVFSDWLLSLSNMCMSFLCAFLCGLKAHFFLLLNNIPLSGCTTVYLSIYLLEDIRLLPSLGISLI